MLRLTQILRCERGANAIEYALVASLISIAALLALRESRSQDRHNVHATCRATFDQLHSPDIDRSGGC